LVTGALLAGSLVGPPLVQAATATIVTIQGSGSTNKAKVSTTGQLSVNPNLATTGAGQVEAAPADPGKAVVVLGGPSCAAGGIYTVPAGQALIITGVNFYNAASAADMPHELDLDAGPVATPCTNTLTVGIAPSSEDDVSQNQAFSTGIPVPAGDAVGVAELNELGKVEFYGYLVPSADLPAAALRHLARTQVTIRH
jgi:hypothetical protein